MNNYRFTDYFIDGEAVGQKALIGVAVFIAEKRRHIACMIRVLTIMGIIMTHSTRERLAAVRAVIAAVNVKSKYVLTAFAARHGQA